MNTSSNFGSRILVFYPLIFILFPFPEMHISEEKGGTIEPFQSNRNDFPKDYLLKMPLKVQCDTVKKNIFCFQCPQFHSPQLEKVQRMNANDVVNICAVVAQVQDLHRFSRKDGSVGCHRSIFLSDGSLNWRQSQVMKIIL